MVEDIAAGEQAILTVPPLLRTAQQAGVESCVGQVAAMKAAHICADSWSSREAVHADGFYRHAAKLRVEYDEPSYDFPIEPEELDYNLDSCSSTEGQMTFVDDGDLEPDVPTNDYGDELRESETYGGFHYEGLLEVLDEAIAEKDIERATFVAFELCRSDFHEEYWERIAELGVLYSTHTSLVSALIAQYEEFATERWEPDGWQGRLCAIHAAITVIRKGITTETVDRCKEFHELAERRIDGDAEFPVEPEELDVGKQYCVAADKHTRPGAWTGRDWKHFWLHAARVGPEGEPQHSREWIRARLRMEADIFREQLRHVSEKEIDHALSPVSEDNRWKEDRIAPDEELDAFE